MKVAFIGVGNMGGPMARNLKDAGFDVCGYNRSRPIPHGINPGKTLESTVANASLVVTMLPDGDALQNVVADMLGSLHKGAMVVDCSTTDVASAQTVSKLLQARDLRFLDAPVSGGTTGAEKGTLTFMAGGSAEDFETVLPILKKMGSKAVHCGEAGAGQAAKICNQMIAAATMISTCESFLLAQSLGLDPQKLFDVVSTSSGYSWAMNDYCPWPGVGPETPADRDYAPGFAAELMLKDAKLALTAGWQQGRQLSITEKSVELFTDFVEDGGGAGRDFSAIINFLKDRG
ncbi:3-hydroxyisobutyrate dehydrogenase [Leisingera sp. ANG-M1]|uniref:3-hydroxyisobutyrate dehydrogenase n=1 Tax=Leisingera sp. ANG-M1 TaxID=1577895 RepID=UPI00057FC3A1|nr:3-hydroxyisobutyrate dehydrogenase [Leisingera sp. ANG-M1]KIC07695.1 3-hydroxyisobutyrate dehydrogenase [Leisingera sp. ANG-M1]